MFPGNTVTIDQNFEDPAALQGSEEERLAAFRIRDEIRAYLRTFQKKAAPFGAALYRPEPVN